MRKYILITVALVYSIHLRSQNPTFTWAKQMSGTFSEVGRAIVTDASGNIYTCGQFAGTVDFDPGAGNFNITSFGNNDIFVSKLDASGNFLWAKQLGGSNYDVGYAIAVDASGNIYTSGYFAGTADFDPGAGTFNLVSTSFSNDIFISKLNASGNFVWAKRIGGTSADQCNGICLDAAANLYATGVFANTVDFDPGAGTFNMTAVSSSDAFVLKLDVSGNFTWAKQISGTGAQGANAINLSNSGNVCTTGYNGGTADMDPGAGVFNLTSAGMTDIYISVLDGNGNFILGKQMGGPNADYGNSIFTDASGNLYTTGTFQGTADFDPGAITFGMTSAGGDDVFINKLDALGNFDFAKRIGGIGNDGCNSIYLDASNNIYTAGTYSATVDFDPGAGIFNLTSAGNYDIYVNKLDASGNFVWSAGMGGTALDFAIAINLSSSGSIYTTGGFQSVTDFDPGAGIYNMNPIGSDDIFIHKMSQCITPSQPVSISGLTSLCAGAGLTTYSIAAVAGATSYTWSLPGGWSGSSSSNTISVTPGASGVLSVAASNTCGTGTPQTLIVTINPNPTIAVTSGSICSGNSFTLIPSGANTYSYSSGSAIVSPTTTSSYSVTGTSSAGCLSSNTAISNVTVNSLPTIAVNSGSICSGFSFTMSPSGASTYTFSSGSAIVSPTANTSYSVTGTSSVGCVGSNTAVASITVNSLPIISVNSGSICSGNSFTMIPNGASTYTFSGGSAVVSPTANASYSVTGTSSAGCVGSNTAVASVTVNSIPIATANTTQTLTCVNTNATLNGSGVSTYTWSGPGIVLGGNSATPTANMAGTYSLVGTTNGCVSNIATVNLTSNTIAPSVSVTASSNSICIGNSVTLIASGATTYSWSTSSTATSIVVSPATTTNYILTGTNAVNGCTNTANQSIGISPLPVVTANTSASIICGPPFQGTATLTANGASTYVWNTSATTTAIAVSPSVTTVYTVTGTDANGCLNTTSFTQSVSACTGINEATINSELIIFPNPTSGVVTIKGKEGLQIHVYNIIGELIISSELKSDTIEFDLSNQANGIYFISAGQITKKIVKN
jgi:hypothetical protein